MDEAPWIKILHVCHCGYKRYVTDTAHWRAHVIDHPLYGRLTQYSAALLDVQLHNCYQSRLAMRRSPRANAEVMVDYDRRRREPDASLALGHPSSDRARTSRSAS